MRDKRSFLRHSIRIRVEGFDQERLLTECLRKGIPMKDIHLASDIEMTLTLMEWDYDSFLKIVRSRYQVTIVKESGYRPAIRNTFRKKSTIAGTDPFCSAYALSEHFCV